MGSQKWFLSKYLFVKQFQGLCIVEKQVNNERDSKRIRLRLR